MEHGEASPKQRKASPIFLWWAWGSVAYFLATLAYSIWGPSVPGWNGVLWIAFVLSGSVVMLGGLVAAGYVLASFWARTNLLAGVGALVANVACLIYFMQYIVR